MVNLEYLIFILGCLIACAIAFAVNKAKVFNFMNQIKKNFFAYIIEFIYINYCDMQNDKQ